MNGQGRLEQTIAALRFDPLLPDIVLLVLAVLAALVVGIGLWRRARGVLWRAALFALVLGWLANPRLVQETRETLPDIGLLVIDESASMRIDDRARLAVEARAAIEARAGRLPELELRTVVVPEAGSNGTRLFEAAERALSEIPRARVAGVVMVTDGQAHDIPAVPPFDAPLHVLLTGAGEQTDRRLRVIEAPGFGLVGRSVELRVIIEDLGVERPSGAARLTVRRDGEPPRVTSVPVGREHRIEVPIARAGPSVVEMEAETRPGEISPLNNRQVVTINGVRDRLRVLLVSGEPHQGERTWRRLLKADASVDLVHFTILRPPEKDDLTPLNELALIPFPVRELFQVKLRDFDLIVFDRFQNRGILPPVYLRNIADYVRGGGALLMSVGPDFIGPGSLAATPLGRVLPARPAGGVTERAYRPRVTELGQRHPVTAELPGWREQGDPAWGRWYRTIDTASMAGASLMSDERGAPLLLLERVEEGRVALLLSDQIWLWSRGHDGGGPHAELLRRIAHWLMKEPELEEEDLTARVEGGRLMIERRSTEAEAPGEITVTDPDGNVTRMQLAPAGGGRSTLTLPAETPGVWQATDGRRTAFAAAGAANPPEVADLRATATLVQGLTRATGGSVRFLEPAGVPELRRVEAGRDAAGGSWIGLRRNRDHVVTGVAALPLLPPWLALPLILGMAVVAWRREGR